MGLANLRRSQEIPAFNAEQRRQSSPAVKAYHVHATGADQVRLLVPVGYFWGPGLGLGISCFVPAMLVFQEAFMRNDRPLICC